MRRVRFSPPGPARAAYWDLRRHNVAADLNRRLRARGGTRIEIDPVDQTAVAPATAVTSQHGG